MMYSEFLKGTGAPENSKTYEQFLKIEQIYMDCDHMSKEKASGCKRAEKIIG